MPGFLVFTVAPSSVPLIPSMMSVKTLFPELKVTRLISVNQFNRWIFYVSVFWPVSRIENVVDVSDSLTLWEAGFPRLSFQIKTGCPSYPSNNASPAELTSKKISSFAVTRDGSLSQCRHSIVQTLSSDPWAVLHLLHRCNLHELQVLEFGFCYIFQTLYRDTQSRFDRR